MTEELDLKQGQEKSQARLDALNAAFSKAIKLNAQDKEGLRELDDWHQASLKSKIILGMPIQP